MYAQGQRHWPDVDIPFEVFEAHCQRVLEPTEIELTRQHAADLYLACACAERHPRAMRLLERSGVNTIRSAIARIDRDPEFVDETAQDVWEKVLGGATPRIAEYAARGALNAWLRAAAVRATLDAIRRRKVRTARHRPLDEALVVDSPSEEALLIRRRYAAPFKSALRLAMASLSLRDRNVLRMHVQGRCTVDDIARAYGNHRATAARWVNRARRRVFELLHAELTRSHAGLSASELRSIASVLGSALLLTLSEYEPKAAGNSVRGA